MKPFLEYGWRPQTMAVSGGMKAIQAGTIEAYDLAADPGGNAETSAPAPTCRPGVRKSLDDYPIPSMTAAKAPAGLDEDARRRLASLGYISATAAPVVRPDAPRPADMTRLIRRDRAGRPALFVQEQYAAAIPLLRADSGRRRRTISTRRCGSPSRTRCSATSRAAMDAFRRAAASRSRFHRRAHVSRPALRADEPDRSGGAAARTGGGRVAAALSRRSKALARRSGAARKDRRGGRALSAGVSPAADDGAGAGSSRRAGHERAADAGGNCGVRKGARDRGRSRSPRPRARRALPLGPRARQGACGARSRPAVTSRVRRWPCSSAPR